MGAISQAVVALEGVTVPVVPVQRAAGECQRREHPGLPRFSNKIWRILHPNQLPRLAVESLSSGSDQTKTRSRGWRNGGRGWGLSSPSGLGQRLGGTSRATNVTTIALKKGGGWTLVYKIADGSSMMSTDAAFLSNGDTTLENTTI